MKLIQVGIGNANPAKKSKIFELAPGAEAAEVPSRSRSRKQPKSQPGAGRGSSRSPKLEPVAEAAEAPTRSPAAE